METKDKRDYGQKTPNPQVKKEDYNRPDTEKEDNLIPNPDDFDEGDYEDINDNIPDFEEVEGDIEGETRTPGL